MNQLLEIKRGIGYVEPAVKKCVCEIIEIVERVGYARLCDIVNEKTDYEK